MIIAGPSETHAEMAIASLEHGKHTLVEIPIAMNLAGAETGRRLSRRNSGLTLGLVHPMRFREERLPVVDRVHRGEERVSHVQGRFFIRTVGQRGSHRTAAQLDRQPAVAPHHPPGRFRALDGLRR